MRFDCDRIEMQKYERNITVKPERKRQSNACSFIASLTLVLLHPLPPHIILVSTHYSKVKQIGDNSKVDLKFSFFEKLHLHTTAKTEPERRNRTSSAVIYSNKKKILLIIIVNDNILFTSILYYFQLYECSEIFSEQEKEKINICLLEILVHFFQQQKWKKK